MVSLKKKNTEIDLKKDRETGLDLEKKVDVDADSGGIGISFDVTELENGDKISIGYEVEAPIQVGIDYNVSSNELGLSGGFEAPGDLVGLSGGVTIDLNSGEISGGELGVALGGVEVSIGEGKCERSISISIAGVTTTYTQKKDNPDCGDDKEPEPEPEPNDDDEIPIPAPPFIPGNPDDIVSVIVGGTATELTVSKSPTTHTRRYTKGETTGGTDWKKGTTTQNNIAIEKDFINNKAYDFNQKLSGTYAINDQKTLIIPEPGTQASTIIESGEKIFNFTYIDRIPSPGGLLYGTKREINNSFAVSGVQSRKIDNTYQSGFYKYRWVLAQNILDVYNHTLNKPEKPEKTPIPPIQPPENKDMSCCDLEPVLSLLRKMSKVLAIDEMDGEGVKIPKRLFVPGAKGYEECKTYPKLMATQIRIADHLGIHPFKAKIEDSNAAQAGNQKLEVQVVNATAAAKMISELLLENKGDAATRLNLLVRNTVATGQILNAAAIAAKRIREVMRFLSIPVKEQIDYINMPFDFSFGNRDKKKGFQAGAKPNEALDINTEEATEKMLPKFMVNSRQPYVIEVFDEKQGTLLDILLKQSK